MSIVTRGAYLGFGLLVLAIMGSDYAVEWLWFRELDFTAVFWRRTLTQAALFAGAFALVFAYIFVNARRLITNTMQLASSTTSPGQPLRQILRHPRSGRLALGFAGFVAFWFAISVAAQWDLLIRFQFAETFGQPDPIFENDIGFYVFRLPFIVLVQSTLAWAAALGVAMHAVSYYVLDVFGNWRALAESTRRSILRDVAINAVLFLFLWGWGYYLERFQLLYDPGGAVWGIGYVDHHVVLPALWVMMAATAALIGLFAHAYVSGRPLLALIGVAGYGLTMVLAVFVVPGLVQIFVVKPNELELETPYLAHNIRLTRAGFGIDQVRALDYPVAQDLTAAEIAANTETLDNIRLWDWRLLLQTYRQIQEIRLYYRFYDVDVDRYQLDEGYRQVLLSARELDFRLPERARTWLNRTLQYTHGYGLVMSLATQENEEGTPTLIVKDLPPFATRGPKIERPAIYYGEYMPGYRIVNTSIEELDYPKGDANVYTRYDGHGGVPLDKYWKRLLMSVQTADPNISLSRYINSNSRIQLWRPVAERVGKIAPFLKLDADPYLVLHDGRPIWIQDAYTVSDHFPYAEPVENGDNYIRNAVKIVVDAYHGDVFFYVIDEEDPILKAYRAAFPDMFKPIADMPEGLKPHLRYPQDLFQAQVDRYRAYHMTIPQVFYNNEDLWALPRERYGGEAVVMEPYYILVRLPGEDRLQFMLMTPVTPEGRDNMIAWIAGRSDFPNYGELVVFKLPKEKLIFGPLQIEALIDQDTVISRQLSLWDQRGSKVIRGNLLVVPIARTIIYVEPVYLLAEENDVPQLKRVIVAHGDKVTMAPTLPKALAQMFAGMKEPEAAPTAAPAVDGMAALRETFRRVEETLTAGDWRGFGEAMAELKRQIAAPGEAPATTPED